MAIVSSEEMAAVHVFRKARNGVCLHSELEAKMAAASV